MNFNKIYHYVFFLGFIFFIVLVSFYSFYCFNFPYFSFMYNSFSNFFFSFCFDYMSLIYVFMVSTVTFLVLSYSSLYLEHYNNMKFIFLTMFFYFSMIFLSLSNSLLMLVLGWDGLGISSMLLIIFYPNKTSIFNSVMTMFFNRLGDVFLVALFFFSIMNFNYFYFFNVMDSLEFLIFIVICSFSKSAQFPLSSWLPAAMSAPTPISAMVHSSTLVTAGIFFLSSCSFFLFFFNFDSFLLFFSIFTFLLGGALAVLEFDYKKTIAFSTMSQISMILFFIFCGYIYLAFSHMIFHAFFKTLLFVCSGYIFSSLFTSQNSPFFQNKHFMNFVCSLLYISLYMMSGFFFSSSFYTKDLALESFISSNNSFYFLSLLIGSFFTIFYCCNLGFVFSFSSFTSFYTYDKFFLFSPLIIFMLIVLTSGFIFRYFSWCDLVPLVDSLDMNFIFISLLLCLSFNNFFLPFFSYFNLDLFFSKTFFFSILGKFFIFNYINTSVFNDLVFFKSHYIKNFPLINLYFNSKWLYFFAFLLIFFLF